MSASREAFETIVATVPDFQPRYQKFRANWQGEETPWYLAMGELAHYIVEVYEEGTTSQYKDLFSTIELVLHSADAELQNLIWVGLFEDIQNIASHRSFGASAFLPRWVPKASSPGTRLIAACKGSPRGPRKQSPDGGSSGDGIAALIPKLHYRGSRIPNFEK